MGAATFMVYEQQKARALKLKAEQARKAEKAAKNKEAKAKAKKEAEAAEAGAKAAGKESAKFSPRADAKHNEPEPVESDTVHFESEGTAIDLDGDGKPDVVIKPVS